MLATAIDHAVAIPLEDTSSGLAVLASAPAHLVVSEVMTGGASASDEFIELYNPTAGIQPLEGLEVVHVTASGATITRKASWAAGAAGMPANAHLLIANAGGIFATLGDLSYASGLAATGGSVALRVVGAGTAIDAVGWGNATSSWLETRPAPAPADGNSLERLPGGTSGSSQDTDDNLVDFIAQAVPDPQNSESAPISSATPSPTASATSTASATPEMSATPTAVPTSSATPSESPTPSAIAIATATPTVAPTATPIPTLQPTATPAPISIAAARSLPDDSTVTVEGVALTAGDFADGGGYVADATAGIAVLVSDGTFSRGQLLRVTGTLDDRFAQRTIRSAAAGIIVIGAGSDPLPSDLETGAIAEGVEGGLVEATGLIASSASTLSTGIAWDLDDGSGPIRLVVGNAIGIDTSGWERGVALTLIGVVGQRDSSGSGTSGFRLQPRDAADILTVEPAATPTPTPTPTPIATPIPTPSTSAFAGPTGAPSATPTSTIPLVSIAEARAAATGAHLRIRGVVTAQAGLLEAGSAVVQDSTGAILVRLGGTAGSLGLGELVELDGTRATKAGMLSLRVTTPLRLGAQADPEATRRATGALGEADEARVMIARGVVSTPISHPRGGSVSFAIDDGSGPIRVTISSLSGIAIGKIQRGAWLELRGVLGQETTTKEPMKGYRLWPRASADLRVIAPPTTPASHAPACCTPVKPPKPHSGNGQLEDALQGDTVPGGSAPPPTLARTHPTHPAVPAAMTVPAHAPDARDHGPQAAGLVVSGIGLAALAGLAAWFSRRHRPSEAATIAVSAPGTTELDPVPAAPHLALLRPAAADAQNERRILPPT